MGLAQSVAAADETPSEHVLVLGGTGRTGRRLIKLLCADPRIGEITAVVRDPVKAQLVFGDLMDRVNIVEGDLSDVRAWAPRLDGVTQVVTAVSCGTRTDLGVVLGIRAPPPNMPSSVDGAGMEELAAAAKERGVRRVVAVTTASSGTPWSLPAIFLNAYHSMSVKYKWQGEQALRRSGLSYVIIRPFGLGRDVPQPADEVRGLEWTQGKTTAARRQIPRDDVAMLCHEALMLDEQTAARATFEVWSTREHARKMEWTALRPDPPGALPEVDHDAPLGAAVSGWALLGGFAIRGVWRHARSALRFRR
jgi:uncharacterized protein YbjT (DUF2867 family)